jgi:ATP-dependent helicase/nuclease subunit A
MNSPAYQVDGVSASRERFYAVACDPRRSVVVEACAGAGKTWMLVSRIVRALLEGARPHEILAITFTRKAAGEMRERLVDWLRDWSSASPEQRVAELRHRGLSLDQAQAAQGALGSLNEELLRSGRIVEIRTFHAWFSQLLRAAPLELLEELQLSPNMSVMDEVMGHEAKVFRRFHARVLADEELRSDYEGQVLLRGRFSTRAWLNSALGKRIEIGLAHQAGVLQDSVPASLGGWPDVVEPLSAVRDPACMEPLRRLIERFESGGKPAQKKAAEKLGEVLACDDDAATFKGIFEVIFTKEGTLRKNLGESDELAAVGDALTQIQAAQQQLLDHEEHGRMVRLSLALIEEFTAYKREQGLADMADLEQCALALLRDSSLAGWIQERLDARIRHVLIDEFQDTSPLQWHALHAWLSGYSGAGGGFSGQAPPSVFIVGDPKQSIYRFRRAEPRVFQAAIDYVCQGLQGARLSCDHTRRNAPQVLQAVNQVFEVAQAAGEFGGFRAHTTELDVAQASGPSWPAALGSLPLVERAPKTSKEAAPTPVAWRDTLTTPREEEQEDGRQQEARQVAQAVAMLLREGVLNPRIGKPLAYGDIYVLARKRASLRALALALQELHVPFAAPESMTLMDSTEVQDLVALLDALASPSHHLSLARALRSPIFGASDDDLIRIAEAVKTRRSEQVEQGQASWWAALMDLPDEGMSPALRRARHLLTSWRPLVSRLSPHDLLDTLMDKAEVFERVAAAVPAAQREAARNALQALMAQALLLDGARYATLYNFVRALKQRVISLPPPARAEAVQLLTVHGAKGLEAEVVFVMDANPDDQKSDSTTLLIDWPVESEAPTLCAFVYSEKKCPPSLQALMANERTARQREELNGLYVAMTRAKECLVVSASERRGSGSGWANWWQRLNPLLTPWTLPELDGQSAEQPQAWVPYWGLPVLSQQPVQAMAQMQLPGMANAVAQPDELAAASDGDSASSRLGQAVHLALQWATTLGAAGADWRALCHAAAGEFSARGEQVVEYAQRILQSEACASFFDPHQLDWAGNEVAITVQGQVQRIDRLVAKREADGSVCWWVIDYKLHETPHMLPAYRAQLQAYAQAVGKLQPGEKVRCAFITGLGEVVEVI